MKQVILTMTILLLNFNLSISQTYPIGFSIDSVSISEYRPHNHNSFNHYFLFRIYVPANYDSVSSPLLIGIHGSGDDGSHTILRLRDIGDRRNAVVIAPYMGSADIRLDETTSIYLDTLDWCTPLIPGSIPMRSLYKRINQQLNRTNVPTYMIGFSAGAQFVSRYFLTRQNFRDSINFRMTVSADPYGYTFPTSSFLNVPMPYMCGLAYVPSHSSFCTWTDSIFSFLCEDNILQYYNENLGVLNGTLDTAALGAPGTCITITGSNRYERAKTFFAFCDSNALNRGINLQWAYAEVPGIGHDEDGLYNTKASPTDSSTIAETLLFDTPYHTPIDIAPVADFVADTTIINAGDSVLFINLSSNASSYFWYFGDSTMSTAVNPYHVYTTAGEYMVGMAAYNANGCHGWRHRRYYIKVIGTVPVTQLFVNNISISVAPNPARESCEVTFSNLFTNTKWSAELYSLDGRKLNSLFNDIQIPSTTYKYSLQLKNTAPGIYFIKISCNGGYKTQKLVLY